VEPEKMFSTLAFTSKITVIYWRALEITGYYWRLLEITGD